MTSARSPNPRLRRELTPRDLRRREPSRSPIRELSRSPIRDAISLMVDSDDDDGSSNGGGGDRGRRDTPPAPELASTYSSSDEGAMRPKTSDDKNAASESEAVNTTSTTVTASTVATTATPPPPGVIDGRGRGGDDNSEPVGVDLSAIDDRGDNRGGNNGKGDGNALSEADGDDIGPSGSGHSGIGKWRRRDIQIATVEGPVRARDYLHPGIINGGSGSGSSNNFNFDSGRLGGNNYGGVGYPPLNPSQNDHRGSSRYGRDPSGMTDSRHSAPGARGSVHNSNSIPITPLHQIPYVHGGYAAAAPLFVGRSKFASILKKLLPGAYEELQCLLWHGKAKKHGDGGGGSGGGGGVNNGVDGGGGVGNGEGGVGIGARCDSGGEASYAWGGPSKLERMTSCTSGYGGEAVLTTKNSNGGASDANSGNWNGGNANGGNNGRGSAAADVVLSDPVKVMKWAENNPVVSAFGIWNSDSGRRTIKFMQGINLNDSYHDGIFNDWNDRESVITIGSNGNYVGGGGGYHAAGGGGGNSHRNPNFLRPRRRKQERPDDADSDINGGGGGIEAGVGGAYPSSMVPSRPSYGKPALEWDVFLDPNLVRQVDAAMDAADALELKLRKARIRRQRRAEAARAARAARRKRERTTRGSGKYASRKDDGREDSDDEIEAEDGDDFDVLQSHTAAQVEVDRLVSQLMRRTVIAHGSMSQLVLEAMGVAPGYNFGTVVRSSREGSAGARGPNTSTNKPKSPSRSVKRVSLRAGNTEFSLSLARSCSWDEEEEQRDFEALLDPTVAGDGEAGNRSDRSTRGGQRKPKPTAKASAGSKGMFVETWIHVFASTLSLLVKSSGTSNGNGDEIRKKSSSGSSDSRSGRNEGGEHLFNTKNRPARIAQRGLSGFLEKMFLRRDSSFPTAPPLDEEDGKVEEGDNSSHAMEEENEEDGDRCRTNSNNDGMPDRFDDDNSELLTNNDMFSPQTPVGASSSSLGSLCGMTLCLGMGPSSSSSSYGDRNRQHPHRERGETSSFPLDPHASHKMARDVERIADVLGEPLRLVLDLKSRRVPPRVWSRLIDSLRTRGLMVEGIGSFDMDELRVIGKGCSYPLTPLLFFHSVGDLQRACHANEVKNGDTVYFNGGSLMWKRSSIMEAAERGCCGTIDTGDYNGNGNANNDVTARSPRAGTGGGGTSGSYSFQPYAYPRSALSDWELVMCKSTIEDYRRHFNLKIGVYVQEFSISAEALDALSVFVNKHGDIYDQGLAFGGVNGAAVKNIHGDGYWNQRYMGRSWDFVARPSKEMTPLKPEDHHLVQKAIQAGAWGQVGTIYEVMDEQAGALTVPPPREPCNMVHHF